MTKELLLFIQSDNPGLYVNIITHCIQVEGVRNIHFAVNSGAVGKLSEARDKIKKIKNKFEELSINYPNIYKLGYETMPSSSQLEERIIRVLFTNPEFSTKDLNKKFHDMDELIVDISGCNKKVSSDVISSYILNGIRHICCFELDDRVYSQEWKTQGLSRDYHDICRDIVCYEYIDFSKSGTTIKSFNTMRSQGRLIKLLLVISIVLGVMVFVLIQQQQNVLAQYAAIALALVTGLGLINDIFGVADRLK
ncbi:hypothetical protein [Nostoc sp.]|uniref:hypothetical protein n=1 Tax=Nostoc sp. TaxID=1180 RepID=UPI002FF8E5F6